MSKKPLVALAVLLAVAGMVWLLSARREPVYQNRRLTEWLADYASAAPVNPVFFDGGPTGGMNDTAAAIRAIGTNSLPFLLAHIHTYPPWEERLFAEMTKQRIFKFRFSLDDPLFAPSVLALRDLGQDATPALPELLRKAEKSSGSFAIMAAMLALGTNAIPGLELLCQNENVQTRAAAAAWLATIRGLSGRDSLIAWRSTSTNGSPAVMRIGCRAPSDFDALLAAMLQSPKAAIRRASADALAERGLRKPPAPTLDKFIVVPPLVANLKDSDAQVRKSAADALKVIDPVAAAKAGLK